MGDKIKLIVFDLDGTLADSKKMYVETIQNTLRKRNFKFGERSISKAMGPKLKATLLNLRKFKTPLLKQMASEINDLVEQEAVNLKACPGAKSALKRLKASGKFKIVLMTNSTHRFAHNFLHNAGLEEYFDQILGAEDFVDKETAFRTLFRELKVKPEETIYVGDKTSDYRRAMRVGCKLALIYSCSWDKALIKTGEYKKHTLDSLGSFARKMIR